MVGGHQKTSAFDHEILFQMEAHLLGVELSPSRPVVSEVVTVVSVPQAECPGVGFCSVLLSYLHPCSEKLP